MLRSEFCGDEMYRKKMTVSYARFGLLFVLPYFVVFFITQLYPIAYTLFLSFFSWDGLQEKTFVGLKNFKRIAGDKFFYLSFTNTVKIWTVAAIPQLGFALFLAALFSYRDFKGKGFCQAVFYLPNLITATSIAVLYGVLLDFNSGTLNKVLLGIGLLDEPVNWLKVPFWTSFFVSYIQWWQWFGYTTLILMAGMKTISDDLYEAARIDGAGSATLFFRITLPLLTNTLTFIVITSIIGGMQIFDVPSVLTGGLGEPNKSILTMVMYLYNTSFRYSNYGYGSAVAYALFLVILVFSTLAFRNIQRRSR